MPCFLYALWQAGCDANIIKELSYRVNDSATKNTAPKDWDPIMKSLGICIKLDIIDIDSNAMIEKENYGDRVKTIYIGKPFKEVVYDNITRCYPNNDYFELGLIRSLKENFGHYIFNSFCDISPYYLDHYDEIQEHANKNNIIDKELHQVNVKRNNGKYYHDCSRMDTVRALDLIWWIWKRNGFEKMSMEEMLFYNKPISKFNC